MATNDPQISARVVLAPAAKANSRFLVHSTRRFSEVIDKVAAAMKPEKRWTGDISQEARVMRSFAWITGDKAVGDYSHSLHHLQGRDRLAKPHRLAAFSRVGRLASRSSAQTPAH